MAKITTADCKKLLDGYDSPFLKRVELTTKLNRSDKWIRTRKYNDPAGEVCRDFANTGTPCVVVLVERNGGLAVKRERGLCQWEKAWADHFQQIFWDGDPRAMDNYEAQIMWKSLLSEDFKFGVGTDGLMSDEDDDPEATPYYFFQPVNAHEGYWDQHSAIDHLFPAGIKGGEECESTFTFEQGDVTAQLVAAGFQRDKKLDNQAGS